MVAMGYTDEDVDPPEHRGRELVSGFTALTVAAVVISLGLGTALVGWIASLI